MGGRGRYGFYEALDFTPSRLPDSQQVAIVQSFMAHHQGMTIVALANALHGGQMRARFHEDPMVQACDLLLQERIPQDMAIVRPHAAEIKASLTQGGFEVSTAAGATSPSPAGRRMPPATTGAPSSSFMMSRAVRPGPPALILLATRIRRERWFSPRIAPSSFIITIA